MSTHRRVLFWLAPMNAAALKSIENEVNSDSVGILPGLNPREAFMIEFDRESRTPGCLLTLGREGDVKITGSQISGVHCQILLNPKTQEILIRDTSAARSTKVVNFRIPDSLFFSKSADKPRQVVIQPGDNIHLSMGGDNKDLFQYEVVWPIRDLATQQEMETLKADFLARRRHKEDEVTHLTTPLPASRYESRIQTPGSGETWLHRELHCLGRGAFGEVYKTLNMHTGEYFAVKVMRRTQPFSEDIEWRKSILQEVRILETLSYRHIVEYYHSQGFRIGHHPVEIFMGLYEGSLEYLVEEDPARRRHEGFLLQVFEQMLRALMYIASVGIIHRDVKPANILYTIEDSTRSRFTENSLMHENFRFVLADFGLSKEQMLAKTLQKGSPLFMAPEMRIQGAQQTYKVDVYSLGVTMLHVGDAGQICSQPVQKNEDIPPRLQHALQDQRVCEMVALLKPDPRERPSAQALFLKTWPDDEEAKQMNAKPLPIPKNIEPLVARDQQGKQITRQPSVIERRITEPAGSELMEEDTDFRDQ